MNVKKDDVLFFNYGAMFPQYERPVVSISECGQFASVYDLDEEEQIINIANIKEMGTRSPNGSPIGVFLKEVA